MYMVAPGGFALVLTTAIAADVNRADADATMASNSQLRGQYAGGSSGGCLVAFSGFDENDRPIDQTTSYSTLSSAESEYTFDGYGKGNANFNNVEIRVPGPNTSFVPQVTLSTSTSNFTYSVGPKGTVTVILTNQTATILNGPSAGQTVVVDQIVLEGHLGTNGLTLVRTHGAVETLTSSNGSSFPRICSGTSILMKRN